MTTLDLYALALEKGHRIEAFDLPNSKSLSIYQDRQYYIGLDHTLSSQEEKTSLAHELGHCEYGGLYFRHSPLDIIEKHEYRANVWAILRIVPYRRLKEAIFSGCTEPWELAEQFGVTEEFLRSAIEYYTQRKGYRLTEERPMA